jgi:hypothetical protein
MKRPPKQAQDVGVSLCAEGHVVLECFDEKGRLLAECHMDPDGAQTVIDLMVEKRRELLAQIDVPDVVGGRER